MVPQEILNITTECYSLLKYLSFQFMNHRYNLILSPIQTIFDAENVVEKGVNGQSESHISTVKHIAYSRCLNVCFFYNKTYDRPL